jgi:hypothetical protein
LSFDTAPPEAYGKDTDTNSTTSSKLNRIVDALDEALDKELAELEDETADKGEEENDKRWRECVGQGGGG